MKTITLRFAQKTLAFFLIAGAGLIVVDCSDKCTTKNYYTYYEPVYKTTAQIKAETGLIASQPLQAIGRIYLKDQTLFINEPGKGIHLIDNTNPASPKSVGFLNIPGNYDLAILGNNLYADSYIDLVVFDVSQLSASKEVARVEGFFKNYNNSYGFSFNSTQGVITSWSEIGKVSVTENDCSASGNFVLNDWGGIYYDKGIAFSSNSSQTETVTAPVSQTGIGGSTARFTIAKDFLYAIDGSLLAVTDISNAVQPVRKTDITLSWWAETLFPTESNLFLGTRAGMYIYDLTAPASPTLVGQYEHIESCDPVVVEGNYAYVTLFDGSSCHMGTNELQVLDISNLVNPTLLTKYPMTNPHGLGIDQSTLFVCDGNDGLKIFDASDVNTISSHLVAHYPNINALDVIPYGKTAMMIAADGLYQYDYSNLNDIRFLSKMEVVKSN